MAAQPLCPAVRGQRCRPSAAAGFTLVEVLVALFVMAIIAVMGWQGVSTMANSREYTQAATERTLRLQTLIAQWDLDLQSIYDSPGAPGLQFDGAALRLVRRQDDGVQVVVWALREGRWTRWASPAVRQQPALQQWWMTSLQLNGTEPGHLVLLEGVTDWQIYFNRGRSWTNAQSTGDLAEDSPAEPAEGGASGPAPSPPTASLQSPDANRVRLPDGVRLQLGLAEGPLRRDVILPPHRS